MISSGRRRAILPWAPAGLCASLSLITICTNLWLTVVNHTDIGSWAIVFLCFLPLCFLFVGSAMSEMRHEISNLQTQVAELQQDDGSESS